MVTPDSQIYIEAHIGIPVAPGGRLKPRPGDRFLGEALVPDARNSANIHVDQVEVGLGEFRPGGKMAVEMVALADGRVLNTNAPVADIADRRFGMYELTRKLESTSLESTPPSSNWRALGRALGLRRK